jgi:hypothetical protein
MAAPVNSDEFNNSSGRFGQGDDQRKSQLCAWGRCLPLVVMPQGNMSSAYMSSRDFILQS